MGLYGSKLSPTNGWCGSFRSEKKSGDEFPGLEHVTYINILKCHDPCISYVYIYKGERLHSLEYKIEKIDRKKTSSGIERKNLYIEYFHLPESKKILYIEYFWSSILIREICFAVFVKSTLFAAAACDFKDRTFQAYVMKKHT